MTALGKERPFEDACSPRSIAVVVQRLVNDALLEVIQSACCRGGLLLDGGQQQRMELGILFLQFAGQSRGNRVCFFANVGGATPPG